MDKGNQPIYLKYDAMNLSKAALLIFGFLLMTISGCSVLSNKPPWSLNKIRTVPGDVFEVLYHAPRSIEFDWRYRRDIGQYYVLDMYALKINGTTPMYYQSIKVLKSDLPKDFLAIPQKEYKRFDKKDREYVRSAGALLKGIKEDE